METLTPITIDSDPFGMSVYKLDSLRWRKDTGLGIRPLVEANSTTQDAVDMNARPLRSNRVQTLGLTRRTENG